MKIRRIAIRNFRKLRGPVVIAGLGDGLTVIAGDNEEGKSTVLAAVQSVFFDRHRLSGADAQAMQPFGAQVRPEIAVDFELGGARYRLRKAFCQSPEAELHTDAEHICGDAVEERLQQLLRFQPPGRGAAQTEHRGIWGLFWVEQGTSFAPLPESGSSREVLTRALEGEVGTVLGGERGRALLAGITRRYEEVLTPKDGRPRGDYKKAREEVATQEQLLQAKQQEQSAYEDKVDQLAAIRGRLAAWAGERHLETAEAALKKAEDDAARLQALQRELERAESDERLAGMTYDAARQEWSARERAIAEQAAADRHAAACEERAAEARDRATAAAAARDQAKEIHAKAKTDADAAQASLDACDRALRRAELKREIEGLRSRRDQAREAKAQAEAARREAETIGLDTEQLNRLRHSERQAEDATLTLQAVATRLDFAPDGERLITRDGRPLPAGEPLRLTEPATLGLEGFGAVTVTPGGEDLADRRRAVEDTAARLAAALAAAGVTSVCAAEDAVRRKQDLLREASTREAIVAAHAPEGIDALQRDIASKAADLAALSREDSGEPPAVEEAKRQRDDAARRRDQATAALQTAADALADGETACITADRARITAEAEAAGAARRRQELATALAAARERAADAELRQRLDEADVTLAAKRAVVASRREAIAAADPERIRAALDAARQDVQAIRDRIADSERQARDLDVELRTIGQTGLGEDVQRLQGKCDRARARLAGIEREAKALKLLLQTLREAESAAKQAFLVPVKERIRPYLRTLFPDGELVLGDDDLGIRTLRRRGVEEPFPALSVGTREQLAVLTRIAFADYLREQGRPAALILDDALVYADDDRFERMLEVLRTAAEHLQILILTCHERRYRQLGTLIRLAECGAT